MLGLPVCLVPSNPLGQRRQGPDRKGPAGLSSGSFASRAHCAPGSVLGLCLLVGTIAMLALQTRKMKNREATKRTQGCTASSGRNRIRSLSVHPESLYSFCTAECGRWVSLILVIL